MTEPHRPDPPDRDPALDAAWKAHSTESPPPRLDAAILAAAHREARTRPREVGDDDGAAHARGPSRTWWGLAAAATIGAIAFGVLQLAPPSPTDPSATVATDMPRTASEGAPIAGASRDSRLAVVEAQRLAGADTLPQTDAPAASREEDRATTPKPAPIPMPGTRLSSNAQSAAEPKQRRADAPERQREPAVDSTVASRAGALAEGPAAATPLPPSPPAVTAPRPFPGGAPAPSVAAAPASPSAPVFAPPAELAKSEVAGIAADARRRESGERMAAAVPTPPAAQAPRSDQADAAAAQGTAAEPAAKLRARPPSEWIERIRALHADRRLDDAARELNAFRDAYPDADVRLPPALQVWAASIKPN